MPIYYQFIGTIRVAVGVERRAWGTFIDLDFFGLRTGKRR